MKNKIFCYNCGVELLPSRKAAKLNPRPDNSQTREHVPPRSLFEGIDEKDAPNRITVHAACKKCNGDFSADDEELRNYVGLLKDGSATKEVQDSVFTSLSSKMNKEPQRFGYVNGQVNTFAINFEMVRRAHEKNFRALFYHQYGVRLPDQYKVTVLYYRPEFKKGPEWDQLAGILKFFELKHSGSTDLFNFTILPMAETVEIQDYLVTEPSKPFIGNESFILGILSYHNIYQVIVGATLKEQEQFSIEAA